MIDLGDPQQVEDAVSEIQQDMCRILFLQVRDEVGMVLEEAVVRLSYLLPDGVTVHSIEVHLQVDKEEFEEMFMEFAKERLMNDAKRLFNLPTDDRDSEFPLSTDDPEDPDQPVT